MAIKAFRETFVTADALEPGDFSDFGARAMRYELYWSFYENSVYSDVHSWAKAYRNRFGLYKYTRGLYNPAFRLGDFWTSMIWGGELDKEAGDVGAIPIETDDDNLRAAISQVWQWSNWSINKDILTLHGAVLGDAAIYVRDDPEKEQVWLDVLHPGILKSVTVDHQGFIKAYEIEETRLDAKGKKVTYGETAERQPGSENVIYKTFMNGRLYAWNEKTGDAWEVPYGFIPMVVIQHHNVGLEWGWSEMHPGRSKFHEADDLASKLHDQIRKSVDPVWLFSGVKKSDVTPTTTGQQATTDRPLPGKEELQALYGPTDASAKALVADVNIADSYATLTGLLKELERDYPELQMDIWTSSGDASGRALRVARQRAETKVRKRRAGYDSCLVRAQQMAVAIGGMRGYESFQGFDLTSYDAGKLDHAIATRPVFAVDPLDMAEEKKAFWDAVGMATAAGVTIEAALLDMGWTEEQIQKIYLGVPEQ